jgi:hypothetical protein
MLNRKPARTISLEEFNSQETNMSEHIFGEIQLYKEGGIGTHLPEQFEDSLHRAISTHIKTTMPGTCLAIGNWLLDERNLIMQSRCPDQYGPRKQRIVCGDSSFGGRYPYT